MYSASHIYSLILGSPVQETLYLLKWVPHIPPRWLGDGMHSTEAEVHLFR